MRGSPASLDRQFSNQFLVGRRENQHRKFLASNPSHVLPQCGPRRAGQLTVEKMKLHQAVRVRVGDRQHFSTDHDSRVELLGNLALERSGVRFPFLTLAAREFPVAFEMYAPQTPSHEKPSVAFDDRGRHDDSA